MLKVEDFERELKRLVAEIPVGSDLWLDSYRQGRQYESGCNSAINRQARAFLLYRNYVERLAISGLGMPARVDFVHGAHGQFQSDNRGMRHSGADAAEYKKLCGNGIYATEARVEAAVLGRFV